MSCELTESARRMLDRQSSTTGLARLQALPPERLEELRGRMLARTELDTHTGCLIFTGSTQVIPGGGVGYARVNIGSGSEYGHRLAIAEDLTPEQPFALHLCNRRPCVNPLHLVPGTQQQNAWYSGWCEKLARIAEAYGWHEEDPMECARDLLRSLGALD